MKPLILCLACLLFLSCHKKTSAPPSGVINTVAQGAAEGLATDSKGNFYFINGREVFKVDATGMMSSIAGRGDSVGYAGDGGPATKAVLKYASKITVDGAGNIYISDDGNNRIRKVNTSGIIYTIAGTGTPGYTGDGGPATAACLHLPSGVAVDNSGNVFITELSNHCVRKIDALGVISTVAGTGIGGFSGDGGLAIDAQLFEPAGLAIDKNGSIYVYDALNYRIRKIDASGIISTLAGSGATVYAGDGMAATAAAIGPSAFGGVCVDGDGNVYIVDASNMRIRKVNNAGIISTFAGNGYIKTLGMNKQGGFSGDGGPATDAKLDWVYDVAVDAIGNVYVADEGNLRVRKVNK